MNPKEYRGVRSRSFELGRHLYVKEKSSEIQLHNSTEGLLILEDGLQHLAQAELVANDILPSTAESNPNRIGDVLPHLTQADVTRDILPLMKSEEDIIGLPHLPQARMVISTEKYETPKKQIRGKTRKEKLLTNDKLNKTPELLRYFRDMNERKKNEAKPLDKNTESTHQHSDRTSPPISKVKVLRLKFEGSDMKRLSKGGPLGQNNSPKTSGKKCKGTRKLSNKKIDVLKVCPNQPTLSEFCRKKGIENAGGNQT